MTGEALVFIDGAFTQLGGDELSSPVQFQTDADKRNYSWPKESRGSLVRCQWVSLG